MQISQVSENDGQAARDSLCQQSYESNCMKRIPSRRVEVNSQARVQTLKAQLQDNQSVKGITPVIQHKETTVVNSKPSSSSSTSESVECVVSKDKFQGLNVNSDILPSTSKKIWSKHGNIFQGFSKHRNDLVQEKVPGLNNDDRAPAIDSSIQLTEDGSSKETFQGVDVSSNLAPSLHKIWDKHGNIIQRHVVHSNGLLIWGLESLAKIILILQSSSEGLLTDDQAKYLDATLLDLQLMHFRVDWLVPFVKCALARRKRQLELGIPVELRKKKYMLLAELSSLDKELDKHMKLVCDNLLISAKLDPTKVLS